MRQSWVLALLALAATAAGRPEDKPSLTPVAEEARFRLRAGAWFTGLDGTLSAGDAIAGTTTELDLQDTLGLPSNKSTFIGSIGIDLGSDQRWHLDLGYSGPLDYSGTSGNVNISFNGLNYSGVVRSDASIDVFEITTLYDLTKPDAVVLSVGAGSRIFNFEGSVVGTAFDPSSNTTQVRSSSADAVVPIPGLAAALRWDITPRVNLRAEAQGLYVGSYGSFFDARAEVGFDFTPNIGIYGGYRWMHAEADVSDVDFSLNLRGPYVGLEVRF